MKKVHTSDNSVRQGAGRGLQLATYYVAKWQAKKFVGIGLWHAINCGSGNSILVRKDPQPQHFCHRLSSLHLLSPKGESPLLVASFEDKKNL